MRLGASAENGYTSVHVSSGWLILRGASGNNLKHLDAAIPVGLFTCVTGVSGSGKSTLIQDTLYPRLLYVEDPDDRGALRNEDDLGAGLGYSQLRSALVRLQLPTAHLITASWHEESGRPSISCGSVSDANRSNPAWMSRPLSHSLKDLCVLPKDAHVHRDDGLVVLEAALLGNRPAKPDGVQKSEFRMASRQVAVLGNTGKPQKLGAGLCPLRTEFLSPSSLRLDLQGLRHLALDDFDDFERHCAPVILLDRRAEDRSCLGGSQFNALSRLEQRLGATDCGDRDA
jgi:hypothetical protein